MATRETSHSATIIDHAFTNFRLEKFQSVIINKTHLSDHKYMMITMHNIFIPKPILSNTYVKINFKEVQKNLTNFPSNSFDNFHSALIESIESNKQQIVIKTDLSLGKPWFTLKLSDIGKKRDKFYILKNKFPSNSYFREKFSFYRNFFRKCIRHEKKFYYEKRLKDDTGNPKKVWEINNEIIHNVKNTNESEISLKIDNQMVDSDTEVANCLNEFFVSVGSSGSSTLQPIVIHRQVPQHISFSIFPPTSPDELKSIIKNLENPAAGHDSIKTSFIKENIQFFAPFLSKQINIAFQTGKFPSILKIAKIKPIFKQGDKTDPTNYRPIALLSIFSKIYEICIKNRLFKYINDNNLINPMQFGFIQRSSTTSAAIHLIELIVKNLEKKLCTSGLFIDLSKAFDCLKHDQLERILLGMGIESIALSLIMDYFKDRSQFVLINSSSSPQIPISNGIQQGSTLGPLIFLLYVNHVFTLPLNGKLILYADDCALVYGACSYEELSQRMSQDISILITFFSSLNLQINLKKSKYIIFKPSSDPIFDSIIVNHQIIERVDSYRYLGLIIDYQLKWTDHANYVSKILAKYCALFFRIRNYLKIKTLITIYFALVHSHLTYMLPVWGGAAKFIKNDLEKLQTKILKLIYRKPRLANVDNFYKFTVNDSILRFSLLVDYEAAYFVYKVRNGLIKCHSNIQTNYEVSGRVTRGSTQLRRGDFITTAGQNSIFYRGILEFNQVPGTIRSSLNLNSFKRGLKQFIRSKTPQTS
jgi:hypothetical protein